MKKLSITKIIDQYGWSYHFIAKEMAIYSRHNIAFQKHMDFNYSAHDIILISSPNISGSVSNIEIPKKGKALNKIIIGQYSSETNSIYQNVDLIVAISPSLYWSAKLLYKDIPVIFLPEAIDTAYFAPTNKMINNPLVVGWAGGPNKTIKRHQLLDELKRCKIIKQMNHGDKFFTIDRTLDEMRDFYKKIDIFVLPSLTECMPRVLMEAMAMGKTCLATNVGSNPILLSPQNILSVYPDSQVLKEMQYKIDNIQLNGRRNREWIETYFSWKVIMSIWDRVFEALINKDFNAIDSINNSFVSQWNKQFIDAKNKIQIAKSMGYNYEHEIYQAIKPIPQAITPIPTEEYSTIKNFILKIPTNVVYWLIQDSCLRIVKFEKLPTSKLTLAVRNKSDYDTLSHLAKNQNVNVHVEINEKCPQLKEFGLKDLLFKVPSPVVAYLEKCYNKQWKDL